MSDSGVAKALRSDAGLVVVEAPAGCGKTYQAADYAHWFSAALGNGRMLILTHTHAACEVFRDRTKDVQQHVEISTIDSFVSQIAGVYHLALGLPQDVGKWAREQGDQGFELLAAKAGRLLANSRAITASLVARYPVVLCDEHQDSNAAQHLIIMEFLKANAKLRIFGDPMQSIYVKGKERKEHFQRWDALSRKADLIEKLDQPHRWAKGSLELGKWVLAARHELQTGGSIDLRTNRPAGLGIIVADNNSPRPGGFSLERDQAKPIWKLINAAPTLLLLSSQNATIRGIHAYFGRQIPIWEGHTRSALYDLVEGCSQGHGKPVDLAKAVVTFIQGVSKGFSDSAFANRFLDEVSSGATKSCRGTPAHLQAMARCLIDSPNHIGVGRTLAMLRALRTSQAGFLDIEIDLHREFQEALRLTAFEDIELGLAEITRRRSALSSNMPRKIISTVHKAKGLESHHVLLMPCDKSHFIDTEEKRSLLYVALSRAMTTLTLVVPSTDPSPLLIGP